MASTGIIQRRDLKLNLISDPPLIGEIVFALDTKEFGTIIDGTLTWRNFNDLITSVSGRIGDIILTKSDVGLSFVDNTSDLDKPVSTATHNEIVNAIASIPQSDWNETDNSSQAYIKNKPDLSNVTLQGNTFNGNSELVQLTASGKLPALDGSNLTNLPSSGNLPDQSGNAGKILQTDGTDASWELLDGGTFA